MRRLGFAQLARENLAEMLRYGTQHWGVARAHAFLDMFIADLDILTYSPEIGRRDGVDYIWPNKQYTVRYGYNDIEVTVLAIVPKGRPSS